MKWGRKALIKVMPDWAAKKVGVGVTESYPFFLSTNYIPFASFSPYATAGVQYRVIQYGGDLFDDESYDLDDSENAFGWLLGAGAEFDAGKTMEIFGEILYEAVDPDRDIDNAIADAEDYKYDQWSVRAGLTFF